MLLVIALKKTFHKHLTSVGHVITLYEVKMEPGIDFSANFFLEISYEIQND